MRIDAHQFFTPEHQPEHLGPILKRNRFDGSIAVASSPEDTRYLLAAALQHDYIRGVVACCAGPRDLEEFRRHPKFVGVTGMEGGAVPHDVALPAADLLPLLERDPGARIALVHLGLPDGSDAWFRAMEQIARAPNVYVKASGLTTQFAQPWNAACFRPYVRHALACFGPGRLMFGSGWPAGLPVSIWKESLAAFTQAIGPQSMEAREEMLGGAACRFYGIDIL